MPIFQIAKTSCRIPTRVPRIIISHGKSYIYLPYNNSEKKKFVFSTET